jgi:predicted transcriptional regulator
MAEAPSKTAFLSVAGSVIVVLAGAFLLAGVNGKVDDLSATVSNLEQDVERLEEIQVQLDEIEDRLNDADEQLRELEGIREELITAICEITNQVPCIGGG